MTGISEPSLEEHVKKVIQLEPDMLVILGNTLPQLVSNIQPLLAAVAAKVHQEHYGLVVYVNKTPPPAAYTAFIDIHICGEPDEWCKRVITDGRTLKPQGWRLWCS